MNGDRAALYDFAACRAIDRAAQGSGIAEAQLMGQAALASLYALRRQLARRKRILILCGSGNNGGDGLALAYMLLGQCALSAPIAPIAPIASVGEGVGDGASEGHGDGKGAGDGVCEGDPLMRIKVFALRPQFRSEAARLYARLLEQLEVPLLPAADLLKEAIGPEDIVVEALLGSGQSGPLRQDISALLEHIYRARCRASCSNLGSDDNSSRLPFLLSLDIPAGLGERRVARFVPPGNGNSGNSGISGSAGISADPENSDKSKDESKDRSKDRSRDESRGAAGGELPLLAAPDEIHSYGVDKLALRLDSALASFSRILILPMGFHPEHIRRTDPAAWRYRGSFTASFADSFSDSSCDRLAASATYQASPSLGRAQGARAARADRGQLRQIFLKDPRHHKYSAGHGLLIGGSQGMEGAVLMAANAFFAAGGGILHVLAPEASSRQFLTSAMPSVMFHDPHSFPEDLQPGSILIGPGLRREDLERLRPCIQRQLQKECSSRGVGLDSPSSPGSKVVGSREAAFLLLDAGALSLCSDLQRSGLGWEPDRFALLPHKGEWQALGGPPVEDLSGLREAIRFHKEEIGGYLLLKDSISILFSPPESASQEEPFPKPLLFCQPNPALATAGSGDSLAGILLALFARRGLQMKSSDRILAGLRLLHAAVAGSLHPVAGSFAELIRRYLDPESASREIGSDPLQ